MTLPYNIESSKEDIDAAFRSFVQRKVSPCFARGASIPNLLHICLSEFPFLWKGLINFAILQIARSLVWQIRLSSAIPTSVNSARRLPNLERSDSNWITLMDCFRKKKPWATCEYQRLAIPVAGSVAFASALRISNNPMALSGRDAVNYSYYCTYSEIMDNEPTTGHMVDVSRFKV